jgi:hypothetical protein
VKRQYLQLHSEVHPANLNIVGHLQHDRGKVQDAPHPTSHQQVTYPLRGGDRGADHANGHLSLGAYRRDAVDVVYRQPTDGDPDQILIDVEQGRDREAAVREARVVGKCVTKVADADHGDTVVPGKPE